MKGKVTHGDPKFIQDEVGKPMARGQSEKGNIIHVDDVASSDNYERVACYDQPRGSNTLETMVHKFWDYLKAKATWEWAFTITHNLLDPPQRRRKKAFDAKQCLFTNKLPNAYRQFSCIWTLVKGLVLWATWLDRNDKIFNNSSDAKLGCTI